MECNQDVYKQKGTFIRSRNLLNNVIKQSHRLKKLLWGFMVPNMGLLPQISFFSTLTANFNPN